MALFKNIIIPMGLVILFIGTSCNDSTDGSELNCNGPIKKLKMSFNQQEFNQFIIKNNIVGTSNESITLKSGRSLTFPSQWFQSSVDGVTSSSIL